MKISGIIQQGKITEFLVSISNAASICAIADTLLLIVLEECLLHFYDGVTKRNHIMVLSRPVTL